jgi:hypothetical protein
VTSDEYTDVVSEKDIAPKGLKMSSLQNYPTANSSTIVNYVSQMETSSSCHKITKYKQMLQI